MAGHWKYFWAGHRELDFLDNGFDSPFQVEGATFRSVWWYMWYSRAKACSPNSDLAVLIREADTQEKAKQLSRRCTGAGRGVASTWASKRLKVMARAVLSKFDCSQELGSRLLATGEDRLVYASKFDGFYGIGFTMKEAMHRRDEWGKNHLGEILMLVRRRLKERGGER